MPRIDFVAEIDECPGCGGGVHNVKTRTRPIATLAEGVFEAREIFRRCKRDPPCSMVGSRALARVVPPRQSFGYDLIVYAGLARYLRNKQRTEIRTELLEGYGIELSEGSISNLCDRFLVYLEALHLCRVPYLRAAMATGYALHLDATCDKGKGGLFVCMDGQRGWVLVAVRIPSENSLHLQPAVEETVALFGMPMATVRDLGEAGAKAVKPLRDRGVPDLLCHYHFLRAVGKALFDAAYGRLRNILRSNRLRGDLHALLRDLRRYSAPGTADLRFGCGKIREDLMALVLWTLDGDGKKNMAYPFALPHLDFVRRCQDAIRRLDGWVPCPRSQPETRAIRHLRSLVARLAKDPRIATTDQDLEQRWQVFGELRTVLRLTDADLPGGDIRQQQIELPALELKRLHEIEATIKDFANDLRGRARDEGDQGPSDCPERIVLKYLDRYGAKLFGHPAIHGENGSIIAVVGRTNNPVEHVFGRAKQGLRRRLGRANLGRDLQQQPAQAALVHNLRDPAYVRVVCGSLENLPTAFADLALQTIDENVLVRDHRDSTLMRRIRLLLDDEPDATMLRCGPDGGSSGSASTVV